MREQRETSHRVRGESESEETQRVREQRDTSHRVRGKSESESE